jgi:monofunctional biosynthetic peptidoglycan transglycosylase
MTRARSAAATVRWLAILAALLVVLGIALAAWGWTRAAIYPVGTLARAAPRRTALMQQRAREAAAHGRTASVDRRWVPYDRVSPLLRRAILVAEDDAFYEHGGLDWNEIRASARKNLEQRQVVRGGSTITQQLAKNVYLGDQRTLTRKVVEAFLAMRLEQTLTKRRIFELYLNLIEWGDGIYGAEAAARRYFGVSAANLDARQAILLAAVIINPRRFSVLHPSRRIERRVRLIAGRLRRRGFIDDTQYARATLAPPPELPPHPPGVFPWFPSPTAEPETTSVPPIEPAADTTATPLDTIAAP